MSTGTLQPCTAYAIVMKNEKSEIAEWWQEMMLQVLSSFHRGADTLSAVCVPLCVDV